MGNINKLSGSGGGAVHAVGGVAGSTAGLCSRLIRPIRRALAKGAARDIADGALAAAADGRKSWLWAICVPLSCLPGVALAQQVSQNVGVLERSHPEYDALGIHAGGFTIFPTLNLTGAYNDNIFAVETGAKDDFVYDIRPEVAIRSNWNNHSLAFRANSDWSRYAKNSSENTESWLVAGDGRLDVQRDLVMTLDAQLSRQTEARDLANGGIPTARPVRYFNHGVNGGVSKTFNRLKLFGGVAYQRLSYDDNVDTTGTPVLESFRDSEIVTWTARADYSVSPATAVFVEAAPFTVNYRKALPGFSRDYDGAQFLTGLRFEATHLVTGEVGFGYLTQSFASPLFHSVHEPSYRLNLEWFPTQLLTVRLNGNEASVDSGLINVPTYVSRQAQLQADWEFQRDIIVSSGIGYENRDYRGFSRTDQRYTYNATVTYHLRREVGLAVKYRHVNQESNGAAAGPKFDENVATLALVLQR